MHSVQQTARLRMPSRERKKMADQPRMRGFFRFSITPEVTSSYSNLQ